MLRFLVALTVLALAIAVGPLHAADAGGTANGKLTANGKTIILKHAYARKVSGAMTSSGFAMHAPESGETAAVGIFLVLTDVPLAGDLTYLSSVTTAFSEGKVQGISWLVDAEKKPSQQSMHHAALSRDVPGSPSTFEVSRMDTRITGKASSDADFFDDMWNYEISFDAPVAPIPSASMKAGTVSGTVTLDGKVYELHAVAARTEPGSFDKNQKQYVVDLTDVPVDTATISKHFEVSDMAAAGKVHGLSVTIDATQRVISGGFYLAGLESTSSTGWQEFEAVAFDARAIEGRLYTRKPQKLMDHTIAIDVRFNVVPR